MIVGRKNHWNRFRIAVSGTVGPADAVRRSNRSDGSRVRNGGIPAALNERFLILGVLTAKKRPFPSVQWGRYGLSNSQDATISKHRDTSMGIRLGEPDL